MTSAPTAGPLALPALDVVTVHRGADRVVVARRASVPLVQVRALLLGPGGRDARLAAATLLRRPGVRERLDGVGATAQASYRPDGVLVSACAEPAAADALIDVLLEILRPGAELPADVLASEAARLVSADAVAARDPGEATRRASLAAAFGPTSPCAEPLVRGLGEVTPDEVQRWLGQAGPAVVVVCGDVDTGADWGDAADVPFGVPRVEAAAGGARWFAQDRPGSAQTTLRGVTSFPAPGSTERVAADVLQRLLGGGKGSRLVRELRDERGYGYHPGTSVVDLAQTSYLLLEVDVATEVTADAVQVVEDVLSSMHQSPPDGDELELGRRAVVGELARDVDAQGSLADLLLAHAVVGSPAAALADGVAVLTAHDVRESAERMLPTMCRAAAADLTALASQPMPPSWLPTQNRLPQDG